MLKRRLKQKLGPLFLLFFFIAFLFYLGGRKIEKIDCQMNGTACKEEIKKEFSDFFGQNFFLMNPDQKIRAIKALHPDWEKIKVTKVPFNKILVAITTQQAVACLLIENNFFLLDQEARIIKEVDVNPGLPEIEIEKFNAEEIKKALAVMIIIDQYHLSYEKIKIKSEKELVLDLPEIEVLLPTENVSEKIASLQMIISRTKIEGKLPTKIDLRFQKPVVTF